MDDKSQVFPRAANSGTESSLMSLGERRQNGIRSSWQRAVFLPDASAHVLTECGQEKHVTSAPVSHCLFTP